MSLSDLAVYRLRRRVERRMAKLKWVTYTLFPVVVTGVSAVGSYLAAAPLWVAAVVSVGTGVLSMAAPRLLGLRPARELQGLKRCETLLAPASLTEFKERASTLAAGRTWFDRLQWGARQPLGLDQVIVQRRREGFTSTSFGDGY